MLELLKRYKYLFFIIALPYILFVFLLVYPTKKSVTLPGDVSNINEIIKIENEFEQKGSFNSTFVTSNENITLFQLTLCQNSNQSYIYDYDPDYNPMDDRKLSRINKETSVNNAIIVAYEKADVAINYEFIGIIVTNRTSWSSFEVGDIILGSSREEILEMLDKSKEQLTSVNILRFDSNKYVEMSLFPCVTEDAYGITLIDKSYYDFYKINNTFYEYDTYQNGVGGPSGGLLQALSIYNSITEYDYSKGLKISGTGTIDIDGVVGVIGGIKQKVYTASKAKCDVFFCPDGDETSYEHQNYVDALEVINDANKKYGTNMKLIPVKTLDEALYYLENYAN